MLCLCVQLRLLQVRLVGHCVRNEMESTLGAEANADTGLDFEMPRLGSDNKANTYEEGNRRGA